MQLFLKFIYFFWNGTLHVWDSLCVHCQESSTVHTAVGICPDDGHRDCPKYVEFNSKNKFEKLVHVVGFVIRIYREARVL